MVSFPAVGKTGLFPFVLKDRSVGVGPDVDGMKKDGNPVDCWGPGQRLSSGSLGLVLSKCPCQCSGHSVHPVPLLCGLRSHPGTVCSMSSCVFHSPQCGSGVGAGDGEGRPWAGHHFPEDPNSCRICVQNGKRALIR